MRPVVEGLEDFAGRGACTDAERRAALWLHGLLRARGYEAWVETRWVRPQRAAALALACLATAAGGLLATVAPVAGLAVAAVGFVCLAVDALGRRSPLLFLFPRRATQHVLAGPDDPELLVVAAYDVPRGGLVRGDRWRARLRRLPYGGLAACGAVVTAAAAARVAEVDAAWVGVVQLLPTLVLLAAVAAAVDVALSDYASGDASGVGVAIALFEALDARAALLLVGAGHAVPRAVEAHLRREGLAVPVVAPRAGQPDDEAMQAALDELQREDAERREVVDRL